VICDAISCVIAAGFEYHFLGAEFDYPQQRSSWQYVSDDLPFHSAKS
jgi:hypothetical protein